jgi:DNA-binding transcriptional ArsR family regulator
MTNKLSHPNLDATFAALSDPTRRAILARQIQGEATVTELKEPFDISLPAISKHLRVLERAGLLERRKEGRTHRIMLAAHPLRAAAEWLAVYEDFWADSFDALATMLKDEYREGRDENAPAGD